MTEFYDIQELVKLFNPPRNDDDSDDDYNENGKNITDGQEKSKEIRINPYSKINHKREDSDITCLTDVSISSETDWKKTPKWDISYRQKVTTSDVFLQMGAKTPSTSSCEDMIVTVDLPGEHMQNMDIKVLKNKLEVVSPNFTLIIPLPQQVHPQKGNAKWDNDQEKLIVTLTMEREFDFVNF